jgi:hypothetical protein
MSKFVGVVVVVARDGVDRDTDPFQRRAVGLVGLNNQTLEGMMDTGLVVGSYGVFGYGRGIAKFVVVEERAMTAMAWELCWLVSLTLVRFLVHWMIREDQRRARR